MRLLAKRRSLEEWSRFDYGLPHTLTASVFPKYGGVRTRDRARTCGRMLACDRRGDLCHSQTCTATLHLSEHCKVAPIYSNVSKRIFTAKATSKHTR